MSDLDCCRWRSNLKLFAAFFASVVPFLLYLRLTLLAYPPTYQHVYTMPTRVVNDETQDATGSMFGETAGASDLAWMAEEFGAGPPAGGGGTEDGTAVNDSAFSASFFETLEDMRRRGDATVNQNQQQPPHRRGDANNNGESDVSSIRHEDQSNSLSRTFDEEDLVVHQEQQQAQHTSQSPEKLSPSLPSLSQEHQQSMRSQNNDEDDDRSTTLDLSSSFQLPPPRRRPRAGSDGPARAPRKMGPNEKIYVENYQSTVQNRIQQFRRQFPNQLPVYADLSDADKLREQQRVLNLLQRLHITGDNKENHLSQLNEQEIFGAAHASAANRLDDAGGTAVARSNPNDVDDSLGTFTDNENSVALLTPPPQQQQQLFSPLPASQDMLPDNSMELQNDDEYPPPDDNNDDDVPFPDADNDSHSSSRRRRSSRRRNNDSFDSTQSVEHTRTAARYDSPATVNHKKRLASTSGKRGADVARVRLDAAALEEASSQSLLRSIGRLSLHDEQHAFTSSQSPISQHLTHSPLRAQPMMDDSDSDDEAHAPPDISFGHDDDDDDGGSEEQEAVAASRKKNVIRHDHDSLVETTMLVDKKVRWDFEGKLTKEAPTDVRLAAGKTFHYSAIPLQHRPAPAALPTQTFPDPLSFYPDQLQRRLGRLYKWILQRDQALCDNDDDDDNDEEPACAVLSIQEEHIVDLVLKITLEYPPAEDVAVNPRSDSDGVLQGNTLIVARSKEDLEVWSQNFREGSAYSVLDHASLPMKQRKTMTTAEKAAQFDVVLTTYDALKATDMTVSLNEKGHAVHKKATEDGWYTTTTTASKSSQSVDGGTEQERTSNKQLSVLHRISWRRVVFSDALGRKCFLAKAGTARVQAATALNAQSRCVLFRGGGGGRQGHKNARWLVSLVAYCFSFLLSFHVAHTHRLAFFVADEDDKKNPITGIKALKQGDKSALSSLSTVLRLEYEDGEATGLRRNIVDFVDKAGLLAMKKKTKR